MANSPSRYSDPRRSTYISFLKIQCLNAYRDTWYYGITYFIRWKIYCVTLAWCSIFPPMQCKNWTSNSNLRKTGIRGNCLQTLQPQQHHALVTEKAMALDPLCSQAVAFSGQQTYVLLLNISCENRSKMVSLILYRKYGSSFEIFNKKGNEQQLRHSRAIGLQPESIFQQNSPTTVI